MRYLGGKRFVAPKYLEIINRLAPDDPIWDAFCGGLGFAEAFSERTLLCTDVNPWLITLYKAWQDGWRPDLSKINKELHTQYKATKPIDDPMTAFLGFGCSFSGKWFQTFSGVYWHKREQVYRNTPQQSYGSLDRFFSKAKNVTFNQSDFLTCQIPETPVVYCDPPYDGTEQYQAVGSFSHDLFWKRCDELVKLGKHVFVSEQETPEGWEIVFETARKPASSRATAKKVITERLFYKGPK